MSLSFCRTVCCSQNWYHATIIVKLITIAWFGEIIFTAGRSEVFSDGLCFEMKRLAEISHFFHRTHNKKVIIFK
jgi:hypothetical protein